MSHFTVLVPAENEVELEKTLLPYHEYECAGIEEYTEFVVEYPADEAEQAARDIVSKDYVQSDKDLKEKYEGYLESGDLASLFDDWSGYKLDEDGNVGRITNPNAKWDWWIIGGRYTGRLHLNDGITRVDSACVGNINWMSMKAEQLGWKMDTYDTYHSLLEKVKASGIPDGVKEKAAKTWDDREFCREAFTTVEDYTFVVAVDNVDEDRKMPFMLTFQESADIHYKSREEYAAMFSANALTYAFIDTEGNWNQRGEMGWWGMDNKEKGTPDYDAAFWKFVESLEPEQRIYIVDCHI